MQTFSLTFFFFNRFTFKSREIQLCPTYLYRATNYVFFDFAFASTPTCPHFSPIQLFYSAMYEIFPSHVIMFSFTALLRRGHVARLHSQEFTHGSWLSQCWLDFSTTADFYRNLRPQSHFTRQHQQARQRFGMSTKRGRRRKMYT